MSAIRITAEPARLYLMKDGSRVRIIASRAGSVLDSDHQWWPRSIFETAIESVLE